VRPARSRATSQADLLDGRGRAAGGVRAALDPIAWIPFEGWIRWDAWDQAGVAGEPGGSSVTSSWPVPSGSCWMRAKTVGAVARELDLTPSSLGNWVRHARAERTKGKSGLMQEEREELTRLRKENRELRIERDLLRKVSALFARHQA